MELYSEIQVPQEVTIRITTLTIVKPSLHDLHVKCRGTRHLIFSASVPCRIWWPSIRQHLAPRVTDDATYAGDHVHRGDPLPHAAHGARGAAGSGQRDRHEHGGGPGLLHGPGRDHRHRLLPAHPQHAHLRRCLLPARPHTHGGEEPAEATATADSDAGPLRRSRGQQ